MACKSLAIRYYGWVSDQSVQKKGGVPEDRTEKHSVLQSIPQLSTRRPWWEAESFTSHCSWRPERRIRAHGLSSSFLSHVSSTPPTPPHIRSAHCAILKSGWLNYFLTIVSSCNTYISRSLSLELLLTCSCRIFYLTPMKTTERL